MAEPRDLYGSFGSVPDVSGGGQTGQRYGSRASGNDFGAQVGEALEKRGAAQVKIGDDQVQMQTKFAEEATEAKVNDDYANKYMPAAVELRNQYDQLQGQDKVHAYDGYVNSLRALNESYQKGAKSPYEQRLVSGVLGRHLASETESAKRELVTSQIEFNNKSAADKIMADTGYAVTNYNNPQVVDGAERSIDSTITLQHINNGIDPASPEGNALIEEAQRVARGGLATGMIKSAVSKGDINEANKIRERYGPVIPGFEQLSIDNLLHTENLKQVGMYGAQALKNGESIPEAGGYPPASVQAVVANTAQNNGVNPNHALTVAMIESNMGKNVGKRGDIGQTGKGGDLHEQAANMVTELKKSQDVAMKALGRTPEPWETYTCYQQGIGGGPALLKASTENPSARAVDVLAPLYKNPKLALDAIVNNGGNASMTSGDYLSFIKKKYDSNAARALCVDPQPGQVIQSGPEGTTLLAQKPAPTLGDNILAAHSNTGEVVQPASSPRGQLLNFDEKMPAMMARAQVIPNLAVRDAVIDNIKQERANLSSSATAYSSTLINQAQKLAVDPAFTSMTQVPPDLMSELVAEHPETLNYLERQADANLTKKGGGSTKDMQTYGPGIFDTMQRINSGEITTVKDLMKLLPDKDGNNGVITLAGLEKAQTLLSSDPNTKGDTEMKTQAFKVIKRQLSGQDDILGIPDPKGEELYARALPKLFQALEDGQTKGLTIAEMCDPSNPNWVGNAAAALKRTPEQMSLDMLGAADNLPATMTSAEETAVAQEASKKPIDTTPFDEKPVRTFGNIYTEYRATNDLDKRLALMKEAKKLGLLEKKQQDQKPLAPVR